MTPTDRIHVSGDQMIELGVVLLTIILSEPLRAFVLPNSATLPRRKRHIKLEATAVPRALWTLCAKVPANKNKNCHPGRNN